MSVILHSLGQGIKCSHSTDTTEKGGGGTGGDPEKTDKKDSVL